MKHLAFIAAAIVTSVVTTGVAHAVSITNKDTEERVVTVTEGGVRSELAVAPNARISTCTNGCFISFPSGDVMAFKGKEEVVIEGGKARITKN